MTFETLALCAAVGLFGPLLALPRGLRIPVVIGELLAGIAIGHTGFGVIDPSEQTLSFLAQVGFALVMFVAGSQVPIRDPRLRVGLRVGAARAVAVGLLATALGWAVSTAFDPPHPGLYAVLMASSSAAVIMPIVESRRTATPGLMSFLPQIAIADAVCIVALPLVIDPPRAVPAALGSITVIAAAASIFFVLRHFDLTGLRRRIHHVSAQRKFALELRLNLVLLFGLAALAVHAHASVMLAGFRHHRRFPGSAVLRLARRVTRPACTGWPPEHDRAGARVGSGCNRGTRCDARDRPARRAWDTRGRPTGRSGFGRDSRGAEQRSGTR